MGISGKTQNASCTDNIHQEEEGWVGAPLNVVLQALKACEDYFWCARIEISYLLKAKNEDRELLQSREYAKRKYNTSVVMILSLLGSLLLVSGVVFFAGAGIALGYFGLALILTVAVMSVIAVKAAKSGRSFSDLAKLCNTNDDDDGGTSGSNDDSNQQNSNEVDGPMMCVANDANHDEQFFAQVSNRVAAQIISKWNEIADNASNVLFGNMQIAQPAFAFGGYDKAGGYDRTGGYDCSGGYDCTGGYDRAGGYDCMGGYD